MRVLKMLNYNTNMQIHLKCVLCYEGTFCDQMVKMDITFIHTMKLESRHANNSQHEKVTL